MVVLDKKLANSFIHGRKSGIGTSPVALTAESDVTARHGILVKAGAGNSGLVYPGTSPNVTAGSNDATDGFELSAGDSVVIEVIHPNDIFVIASAAGQEVFWIGI